jgi:general secretion pathway protein J
VTRRGLCGRPWGRAGGGPCGRPRARRPRGFTLIELLVAIFLLAVLSAFAYGTLSYVQKAREATQAHFARSREVEGAIHTLVTDFEQLVPRPVRQPLGTDYLGALVADPRSQDLVAFTRGGWSNNAGLPRSTMQRVTYRFDKDRSVLVRSYTNVLDAPLSTTPVRRDLLTEVVKVELRFLPATGTGATPLAAPPATPPANGNPNTAPTLPLTSPPPLADNDASWISTWPPLNDPSLAPATAPTTPPPSPPKQGTAPPTAAALPPPLPRSRPRAVEISVELKDYGRIVRVVEVPG